MKRIIAITLFSIGFLAASTGLFAQQNAVTANIPFNFTVGEKGMPAGEYTITSPSRNIIKIKSADGWHVAFVSSSQSYRETGPTPQLVFDKYGDSYFLHRVLSANNMFLRADIPLGNREEKMRSREVELQTGGE